MQLLIVLLLIYVGVHSMCSSGPKEPALAYYLENPESAKWQADRCNGTFTPSGYISTAEELRYPTHCLNATKAVEILEKQKEGAKK